MTPTYAFDGSFEGLLSAVFVAFERREVAALRADPTPDLFGTQRIIRTDERQAERVAAGIRQWGSPAALDTIYAAFLSEDPAAPDAIFAHVRALSLQGRAVEDNPLHQATWTVHRLAKRVGREVHRMHAFVRFEEKEDGLYAATVEPACDVLPLIGDFFRARYVAQRWAIFDARRKYGIYYDLASVQVVDTAPGAEEAETDAADEDRFQRLWRTYFEAVDIPERRNRRLQLRHMPRRYWKHLTETRP